MTERRRFVWARTSWLLLVPVSLWPAFASAADTPGPSVASAAAPAVTTPVPAPVARRPLDLRAPDVRRLLPAEQWRYPLPGDDDSVTIESRRNAPPLDPEKREVPGGVIAPFWALRHPTKAWRIFVPDPNAKAVAPPDPVPKRQP